jgi:hypothetical protein
MAGSLSLVAACLFACALPSHAAVIVYEYFDADPQPGDWNTRDGEMLVAWNNTVGQLPGSMQGTFAEQDEPFFESDAFRVNAAPWIGNYNTLYPGYTQFQFDFMAQDILPSTFIFRISDGTTTFIRNLLPQVTSSGSWLSGLSVSLTYDANWVGGSAAQFAGVLANVSFIDLQIGRSGTGEQDYFVDNFYLLDDPINGGGGDSVVPEASSVGMLIVGAVMMFTIRRRLHLNTEQPA